MKQVCTRSLWIVVLLLAVAATGPTALASESDAKAGEKAGEKAATDKAENAPKQVCEPSQDVAEFNTLEDLYFGATVN